MKPVLALDIGGIFFSPEWRLRGQDQIAALLGIEKTLFVQALKKHKDIFYEGRIVEHEYWSQVLSICAVTTHSPDEMTKLYREYITPVSATLSLLPQLAEKFTLVSCNNAPKEWMDERVVLGKLDTYFSYFFTSGYLGVQKPHRNMYARMTQHDSLRGQSIVYVDDNEEYLKAAKEYFPDIFETKYFEDISLLQRLIA